jgi:hypothetical protein
VGRAERRRVPTSVRPTQPRRCAPCPRLALACHGWRMVAPLGFRALPLPLAQLSLAAVLKCGQSFRWSIYPLHAALPSDPSHEYRLCLQDRVVCLSQSLDTLFYRSVFPDPLVSPEVEATRDAETLLWLDDYFQLDVDLVKLYNEWSEKDPVFAGLRGRFEGIRMLRQDPWENLISCALLLFTPFNPDPIHMHFHLGLYVPRTITSPESRKWSNLFVPSIPHLFCRFHCPCRPRSECLLHQILMAPSRVLQRLSQSWRTITLSPRHLVCRLLTLPQGSALLDLATVQILSRRPRECSRTHMVQTRLQMGRRVQRDGFIPFGT